MKKLLLTGLIALVATMTVSAKNNDIIKNAEYKQIKNAYLHAEGYGDIYNCFVAKQRFCKVKDFTSGVYVLCDRETSRTQMESAKVFYKLGQCTKLN